MEKKKSVKPVESTKKAQIPPGGEKGKTKKRVRLNEEDTGFLVEAAHNIEVSARQVSKKASEAAGKIGDQTTEIAEKVLDKLKKGVAQTYEVGSKAFDDLSKLASDYLEKYDDSVEMRNLREKKDKLTLQLGTQIYNLYKIKQMTLENLLSAKEVNPLLQDMDILNKEIIKLGRKMSRK